MRRGASGAAEWASAAEAIARAIGGRIETLDPLAADVEENLLRAAEALLGSRRQDS